MKTRKSILINRRQVTHVARHVRRPPWWKFPWVSGFRAGEEKNHNLVVHTTGGQEIHIPCENEDDMERMFEDFRENPELRRIGR